MRRCSPINLCWPGILIALGLGSAVGAVVFLTLKSLRASISRLAGKKNKLNKLFDWNEKLERYAPRSLHTPKWVWLIGAAIFAAGLVVFKNPVPATFGAVLCVLIPDQLAYQRRSKHRSEVIEQLAVAIRLFAGEYTVSPKIDRCLAVVGRRVPDPVGKIFREAYIDIIYGKRPDDVYLQMAKELDTPYGHMFVQILRAAQAQGQTIAPLFHDLVSRIAVAQELEKQNKGEISGERAIGLFLAILPLPLYLVLQRWIPESNMFLTGTVAGKFIVFMSFVSGITWFFVDRLVSDT